VFERRDTEGEELDGEDMVLDLIGFRNGFVEVVVNSCRLLAQKNSFSYSFTAKATFFDRPMSAARDK